MTTEFDFTRFVELLEHEEAEKAKHKCVEEISVNRARNIRSTDLKYENIVWKVADEK
tara:strand:- start:357 stop:527 length:171 start_codon:yes stop_codon:yes gene_type:complete